MKLESAELVRLALPLVSPFKTSSGTLTVKDVLLVHVLTDEGDGWGECVAMPEPLFSSEYTGAAGHVIEAHLLPRLFALDGVDADLLASALEPVKGHRMAKAAVEMAILDAQLRFGETSFGRFLGASRDEVDCGVSIGIHDEVATLLEVVARYLDDGYRRIKLKIEPGRDVEHVRAVRERFPDTPLQVDANEAYTLRDAAHLKRLDSFDLVLIEQPLPRERIRDHAELAKIVHTPICLDESITSAQAAADAIATGACSIVNVKPGRVGGYIEARRVHDVCAASGVPVWCGGMLETGLGRAGNIALAALPNFTLPGDISASNRYFHQDLTEPFVLHDGRLRVPSRPGLGVDPLPEVLKALTVSTRTITR